MIPIASSIPEAIVQENVQRLRDLMRTADFGAVIVFHPSNMLAFTGTPHASWDRLTCAAVTLDAGVHLVCPAFERPSVLGAEPHAEIHTWQEDQNAYEVFASVLKTAGIAKGRIGVDGRIWLRTWYAFCDAFGDAALREAEALIREVRICKSPPAQEILRHAHRNGERVFLELRELIRAGVSELDLHAELCQRVHRAGFAVNPSIQSGPNGAIPHNPTGTRVLQDGDNVVVDSVTTTDGFNNDLTRTFAVGEPSRKARHAYKTVHRAHDAAIEAARAGVQCCELDRIARKIITDEGFGEFFTHRLGHGMGIECHEPPYLNAANTETLRPGMCVTIEPGIYVPGAFGVRIEDDILITEDGCELIRGELQTDVSPAFDD